MEGLASALWWSSPAGLGVFFMGLGILLWGISKVSDEERE